MTALNVTYCITQRIPIEAAGTLLHMDTGTMSSGNLAKFLKDRKSHPNITATLAPMYDNPAPDLDPVTGEPLNGNQSEVNSPVTFYLFDHLGNTRVTFRADASDAISITYAADYYPYGKILREYNCNQNRYLSTHHERDVATGYDNRGARLYDSEIGRFLGVDPLTGEYMEWSPYNYVLGNPTLLVDPGGMSIVPAASFKGSKAAPILNKIAKLEGTLPKNIVDKFSGETLNLYFSIGNITTGSMGETWGVGTKKEYGPSIILDKSMLSKSSEIGAANVLIHEIIHAQAMYDLYVADEFTGNLTIKSFNSSNNPSYKLVYDAIVGTKFAGQAHHEFMAMFRRDDQITALKAYDKNNNVKSRRGKVNVKGVSIIYTSNQFYEAMSWGGLQGTKAWSEMSQDKKDLYTSILDSQVQR